MVLSIAAFCIRIYLRNLAFQENLVFFLYESGWSFWIESMRDFNGFIVFLSIIYLRNFTRVRKSVINLELLSCFLLILFDDIFLRR